MAHRTCCKISYDIDKEKKGRLRNELGAKPDIAKKQK
jgi:hypothetical protein